MEVFDYCKNYTIYFPHNNLNDIIIKMNMEKNMRKKKTDTVVSTTTKYQGKKRNNVMNFKNNLLSKQDINGSDIASNPSNWRRTKKDIETVQSQFKIFSRDDN